MIGAPSHGPIKIRNLTEDYGFFYVRLLGQSKPGQKTLMPGSEASFPGR